MADLCAGMITCWYKNISMANYTFNLKQALEKRGVPVRIITSNCICEYRYNREAKIFQEESRLVSQPLVPFMKITEKQFGKASVLWIPHSISQATRGIRYLAKCRDCHIIHYQQSASFSFGGFPLLMLLLVPTPQKKIVTIHNFDRVMNRPRLRILNRVYRYADAIIVHSNEQRKRAIELGIPKYKINAIPHGAQFVKQLGLKRKRITFFGAPIKRKGFFVLIEALRILRNSDAKINLEIYGIYSIHEKNNAIKEAKSLGVDDLLSWYGRLSEPEFDKKMQESMFTFAVYPKATGGSSIITRAMINGTPVIASNVGGNKEYLEDTGIFVSPNDPQALAFAVQKLANNEALREKIGQKARERAETFLSWDNIAEKTFKIYLAAMKN